MATLLSDKDLEFLRELKYGRIWLKKNTYTFKLNPWQAMRLAFFKKKGLVSAGSKLTDTGLDALEARAILGKDERRPRWEIVFLSYLPKFTLRGLRKLHEDLLHDLDRSVGAEEGPRVTAGSFESCPLSYMKGESGSFDPDAYEIEHTENSFVTWWDQLHDRAADSLAKSWQKASNVERSMKKMILMIKREVERRKKS